MSDNTGSTASTAQTAPTAKWVPRWRQNPNAVPSVRLYSEKQIQEALPSGRKNHTFTRALAPTEHTISEVEVAQDKQSEDLPPELPLADEFCRIMVYDKAHLNPPHELWTRNNLEQLDINIGRAVPLFEEAPARRKMFEFIGWYRIVRWTRCRGGGDEVLDFIQKRKLSQASRTREYWDSALKEDWAKVVLEKVNDAALKNPMEKSAS
ncbi:hypothetical protein NM688_g4808 [Phlebia brevispora]|uniref:Uncharacterized protein n=1 Tax=Phlebia brevispora TaxID=194682 RepID=A0ACC1T1W0_9APHY|nr:hypothetical protein NM688_g4808 [Phlebia brevispora]